MAGFASEKEALDALGAKVIAISTDSEEDATTVAEDLNFPVAYGGTRELGETVGAWWGENHGGCIQPSEFIVNADGKVGSSTYSSAPIGRVDAADVVKLIAFREKQAQKG